MSLRFYTEPKMCFFLVIEHCFMKWIDLAQDVNSTQFNKSCSWPSFFLLLESGNTPSPQTPSPHTQRHQDLTCDRARCSIRWSDAQSAHALQDHQLWLPLLLAWANCLTLWNSFLKKREKKIYTIWIIPNLIRLWWTEHWIKFYICIYIAIHIV